MTAAAGVSKSAQPRMVLLVLGLFVAFMSSVLYLTATHAHLDACNAKPSGSQQSNYWKTAGGLLFSRQYRSFQIFIVVLGISTANMYLIPTYGMMLPEWEAGIDTQLLDHLGRTVDSAKYILTAGLTRGRVYEELVQVACENEEMRGKNLMRQGHPEYLSFC